MLKWLETNLSLSFRTIKHVSIILQILPYWYDMRKYLAQIHLIANHKINLNKINYNSST